MDFRDFILFDFLKEESFVKWVVNPDPATNEFWHQWLKNHPEKKKEANRAKEIINGLKLKEVYKMDEFRYEKILDDIILYQQQNQQNTQTYNLKKSSFKRWYVAATLILISILGAAFFHTKFDGKQVVDTPVINSITKVAPAGVKCTIQLPDGTTVKLNSETTIIYPEQFSDSTRIVHLDGEAFFEVVKDSTKPFIVKTGLTETEVLGTSFNLKTFERDEVVEVALISGSVRLKNTLGGELILESYERGIVRRNQQLIIKDQFDVKEIIGWKDGILLFKKATFEQVIKQLEGWYGVEFEVEPSTQVLGVYSGEFRNESLDVVLSGIAYSSYFNFEINGNKVYVNN